VGKPLPPEQAEVGVPCDSNSSDGFIAGWRSTLVTKNAKRAGKNSIYSTRSQVCERPNIENPIKPRTRSFLPPSSSLNLHL